MVDTEVEDTLREIRERVRAVALDAPPARRHAASDAAHGDASMPETHPVAADALDRLDANLATVERTWNRLPPLLSNRQGWMARLELWVKRKIKRATHWYTWEQVNYNASVLAALRETSSALRETFSALDSAERRLTKTESEMLALRQTGKEIQTKLSAQNTELRNSLASTAEHIERLRRELAAARAEAQALRDETDAGIRAELRERIEHLSEEQRVCFKQLSLEASETAVLSDRARRRTDLRLEEIAARLEELRKADASIANRQS